MPRKNTKDPSNGGKKTSGEKKTRWAPKKFFVFSPFASGVYHLVRMTPTLQKMCCKKITIDGAKQDVSDSMTYLQRPQHPIEEQ